MVRTCRYMAVCVACSVSRCVGAVDVCVCVYVFWSPFVAPRLVVRRNLVVCSATQHHRTACTHFRRMHAHVFFFPFFRYPWYIQRFRKLLFHFHGFVRLRKRHGGVIFGWFVGPRRAGFWGVAGGRVES